MRVDLDGDVKTKTPLKLTLHPQKLKILVPKQSI
jgi:diacylglycerol kinase family enzyme